MYDIKFYKDELVQCTDEEAILKINGKEVFVVIIVTNLRIIILKDINKEIEYKNILSCTKNVSYLPEYEILLNLEINKIIDIKLEKNNFFKCILSDTNYFIIKSNSIFNFFKEV